MATQRYVFERERDSFFSLYCCLQLVLVRTHNFGSFQGGCYACWVFPRTGWTSQALHSNCLPNSQSVKWSACAPSLLLKARLSACLRGSRTSFLLFGSVWTSVERLRTQTWVWISVLKASIPTSCRLPGNGDFILSYN